MCLFVDPLETASLRASATDKPWEFYKVVFYGGLDQPILFSRYFPDFVWKPGWNVSDYVPPKPNLFIKSHGYPDDVKNAIHTYRDMYSIPVLDDPGLRVVKVKCYIGDLIAANKHHVAFTKVYLEKDEYESVLKPYMDLPAKIRTTYYY